MKWKVVKLDEIKAPEKGALVSGPFGSNIGSRFFVATGVPVIRGNNLSMGQKRFIDDGFVFITEDKARELRNCNARSDDIIFTAAGTLGQVGLMPKIGRFESYIISNKQIRLRLDTNQAFPLFAYYFLSSPDMRAFIASQNKGSSVPLLTLGIIRNLKIPLPPITTQKRIVAILSAYDELIENNQRRIALLEKMAEEIYREWFVRMRFPGNRETKFNKGLPSNWEICEIGDKFSTCLGGTPSRTESSYWGGEIPWINSGEVNKLRIIEPSEYITENGLRYSATKIMPKRTTVIAITGATLGQVSLTEIEVCANQSVVGVYDNTGIYSEYIYQFVRANIENLIAKQSGGGQQHINKDIVGKEKILLPPLNLIEKYNHVVRPIFNQIRTLLFSTQANTQMRDKLLPRLISGKLSVEHLDIRFPLGMEESP